MMLTTRGKAQNQKISYCKIFMSSQCCQKLSQEISFEVTFKHLSQIRQNLCQY